MAYFFLSNIFFHLQRWPFCPYIWVMRTIWMPAVRHRLRHLAVYYSPVECVFCTQAARFRYFRQQFEQVVGIQKPFQQHFLFWIFLCRICCTHSLNNKTLAQLKPLAMGIPHKNKFIEFCTFNVNVCKSILKVLPLFCKAFLY